MIVVITSLELKNPFHFFLFSYKAMYVVKQLKKSNSKAFKSKGIWTKHYTMSLWENEDDMKAFFMSFGVSEENYDNVAKSFWLNSQVRRAKQYAMKNRVMKTPTLLVNQRYLLDSQKLGTYPKIEEAIIELSGVKPTAAAGQ